jgi:D-alanyl-D-alanine carboxypeptidase/D-alanyl-D-alanine-endopeptidase (penicillin-binding protein 4)
MTNLVSSARQMSEWARVKYGLTNSLLVDHSGLGETSRMSAADLVMALSAAHGAAQLKPLLKQIHIKDSKGRPLYDHPVTVMGKTGTLNFVSGLGGFVTTADGRELVFAIFSADLEKRAGIARSQRDRPRGAKSWNARAKRLQLQLIERWAHLYST